MNNSGSWDLTPKEAEQIRRLLEIAESSSTPWSRIVTAQMLEPEGGYAEVEPYVRFRFWRFAVTRDCACKLEGHRLLWWCRGHEWLNLWWKEG